LLPTCMKDEDTTMRTTSSWATAWRQSPIVAPMTDIHTAPISIAGRGIHMSTARSAVDGRRGLTRSNRHYRRAWLVRANDVDRWDQMTNEDGNEDPSSALPAHHT
jgi:hypothetical protein